MATDTLQHLLELLPIDQQQFSELFLNKITSADQNPIRYNHLQDVLVASPYPMLQILCLIKDTAEFQIEHIIIAVLHQLLQEDASRNPETSSSRFICFLANFPEKSLEPTALQRKLVNHLLKDLSEREETVLALLARCNHLLINVALNTAELNLRSKSSNVAPTNYFVLGLALTTHEHFVPRMCKQLNNVLRMESQSLRNNLLILNLADTFAVVSRTLNQLDSIDNILSSFDLSLSSVAQQEIQQFFYADFQRLCILLAFLQQHETVYRTAKVESLLRAPGVLSLIYEQGIEFESEQILSLIENTYKWQKQTSALRCWREQEIKVLSHFTALCVVYDIIIEGHDLVRSKLLQLSSELRQQQSLKTICVLIEDILQLVFLRWEQLQLDRQTLVHKAHVFHTTDDIDEDDDKEQYVDRDDKPTTVNAKSNHMKRPSGFICSATTLHVLFTFLKSFVTKKLHTEDYRGAVGAVQVRFQRIVDAINDALWRHEVLEKIEKSIAKKMLNSIAFAGCSLKPDELLQLIQLYNFRREKASSDDENYDIGCCYTSSITRRKSKKQRRSATFSGATEMEKTVCNRMTMEQCRFRAQKNLSGLCGIQNRKQPLRLTERSIIPKLLYSTPEHLAILALSQKNCDDVKYIIEVFHLESSPLNHELEFVQQQQYIKTKLAAIYTNYVSMETQCETNTTVEQIKAVAAKGFELSKIISVVDNFAQAQKIQPSVEFKKLIHRHSENVQYTFLNQYEERNLSALIIADLIFNLKFNSEITSNLLLVIRRQQQISSYGNRNDENAGIIKTGWQNTQLPLEMGVMTLLDNLCECMRVLERNDRQPALNELLGMSCYALKPVQLRAELHCESGFNILYSKIPGDYSDCQDLRSYIFYFQQLQSRQNFYNRFCSYIQELGRLLLLCDTNLQYHIIELLKNDLHDVIGQLIYECDVTPLEIEYNVAALNLSLVHVISINICPELAEDCTRRSRRMLHTQKEESIHNYIRQNNLMLAHVLHAIQLGKMPTTPDKTLNFSFLKQLEQLSEIQVLASIYNDNLVVAALRAYKLDFSLLNRLNFSPIFQLKIIQLDISGHRSTQSRQQQCQIDNLISELIELDPTHIHLVSHVSDIRKRAWLLQEHFTKIATTHMAKELIERTLQHKQGKSISAIPTALRRQLEHTLADITVYARVSAVLDFESWPQSYDFGRKTPNVIFEQLLQRKLYELCYEWSLVVNLVVSYASQQRVFLLTLLTAMLEVLGEVDVYLLRIIEIFPASVMADFLNTHKEKLRSLELLHWVLSYLEKKTQLPHIYRNCQISVAMCRELAPNERQHFFHLMPHPLLIIEQILLNSKFEILAKLLIAARAVLQETSVSEQCSYCFDKRGHTYNVGNVAMPRSSGKDSIKKKDHIVTNECIDLLLRIYASKALDYHISSIHLSVSEPSSLSTDLQNSLDSLCDTIQKPAPSREHWVRDEDATHCMCCRRTAFTMLMRRHHCRRCGRLVCYTCSLHRMRIPELYADLEVRVCIECFERRSIGSVAEQHTPLSNMGTITDFSALRHTVFDAYKWRLSGIITHDKLLREEFCYEHAPSVALSLSILSHHQEQRQSVELLLFQCRKLEKLIVPNPEVDYELIAKMMNCLALAAKVKGASPEFETIREHSDIIMAVVHQGCESLVPPGPFNDQNLRKLADDLIETEHWTLALEVHLKFGFPTTGVVAAHGLACLRAGCYETAREKFLHCMTRLSNDQLNNHIYNQIFTAGIPNDNSIPVDQLNLTMPTKRPQRGPALLQEILKLITAIPHTQPQAETLQRASLIRNSNTSIGSLFSRRKDQYAILTPLHEPALNVINGLASLKHISKGNYKEYSVMISNESRRHTRSFEESLHYVLTYGSHADILQFLMQNDELSAALKYFQQEHLESDLFIQYIFQPALATGQLSVLIENLNLWGTYLSLWRIPLLQTCRHLEKQNQLNSLYQLQLLLKDPIRASMTCIKFYSLNCDTFQKLHLNVEHLNAAYMHLQNELDIAQWEHLHQEKQATVKVVHTHGVSSGPCFAMHLNARSLNGHINTIRRQMEVAKFLAKCEKEHDTDLPDSLLITEHILKQIRLDASRVMLPTLFEGTADKIEICLLILLCGKNIDEGFGLAYGIIEDYKLSPMKVFGASVRYLARNQRLADVDRLLNCIRGNNGSSNESELDELLSITVNSTVQTHELETKQALDKLTKQIANVDLRISSYIFIGQLKSAYLIANKYNRLADIRKILRQAEVTNQVHIKKLCEKKLNIKSMPNAPAPL